MDTDLLSSLSPGKPSMPAVAAWMRRHADVLFLTTINVAEIENGIASARGKGATRKATQLAAWLADVLSSYSDRVLPFDLESSRIYGRVAETGRVAGQQPGFPDTAIAAIAMRHDLTVATRNLRHFVALGVRAIDPFAVPHAT